MAPVWVVTIAAAAFIIQIQISKTAVREAEDTVETMLRERERERDTERER